MIISNFLDFQNCLKKSLNKLNFANHENKNISTKKKERNAPENIFFNSTFEP